MVDLSVLFLSYDGTVTVKGTEMEMEMETETEKNAGPDASWNDRYTGEDTKNTTTTTMMIQDVK
jgi:hypothetical protein